jgi:hypothetical protein
MEKILNSWFPEGYQFQEKKVTNNYLKLQDWDNKFRILSNPAVGYVYFSNDWEKDIPHRSLLYPWTPKDIKDDSQVQEFWAFVIYNYIEQKTQILEIRQTTIKKALWELTKSEDWWPLQSYDLKIKKQGKKLETTYIVFPLSKKEFFDKKILKNSSLVNLSALYDNADPFAQFKKTDTEDDLDLLF